MEENFFGGVKIEQVELSTGVRIGLPVRYYDWSAIMAHFPVPAAAVRRLLPTDRLKPAQLVPGTAILPMVAMEYRQSIPGAEPAPSGRRALAVVIALGTENWKL